VSEIPLLVPERLGKRFRRADKAGHFASRADLESAVWRVRAMTRLTTAAIARAVGVTPYTVERILADASTRPRDLIGYVSII
jgi:hypothetical protein